MSRQYQVTYRNGTLIPSEPLGLSEGSKVTIAVIDGAASSQEVIKEAERKTILKRVFKRMDENPWPANAPRFSRDELHER